MAQTRGGPGQRELEELAARLRGAAKNGRPVPPLRQALAGAGEGAAYAVQSLNLDAAQKAGRRIAGRKVGLTGRDAQARFGAGSPVSGAILADTVYGDGEELPPGRLLQPMAEGEVALVLDRNLQMPEPTLADLVRATAYALPAVEIADCRIAGWDIGPDDMIADNACAGAVVLGGTPRKLDGLDLRLCGMALSRRGETVATGAGAACLGHPLNAAVWLARRLAALGQPLAAGDLVLTGALGPAIPALPGDAFECRISGLGEVRALFAP